jgi:hypothetical protein
MSRTMAIMVALCLTCLIVISCAVIGLANSTQAGLLVADGNAFATIVVGATADDTERFAAQELQDYIRKATGAAIPIQSTPQVGSINIYIGRASLPADFHFELVPYDTLPVFAEEAFLICSRDNALYILGNGSRGTLYGVYEFLDRFVGVRWFFPGSAGEYVPKLAKLELPDVNQQVKPGFEFRAFNLTSSLWSNDDAVLWARRNRLNVTRDGDAGVAFPGGHAYYRYLPPDVYFAAHPEYYALVSGQRRSANAQIETANPEVVKTFSENVASALRMKPVPILSISPNDGYGWSESEEAKALDARLGTSIDIVTDRVFQFANEVAEQLAAEFPDTHLLSLAYVNYVSPPKSVKLLPQVIPWVAHYLPACYTHTMADPNDAANKQFSEYLEGWVNIAQRVYTYNYTNKWPGWVGLLRPVERVMAEDVKYQYAVGVRGYYGQSGGGNWALTGPTIYVTTRLLWNPALDSDQILSEYFEFMYAEAAEEMMAYHRELAQIWESADVHANANPNEEVPQIFALDDLARLRKQLVRAKEKAQSPLTLSRIDDQLALLDYTTAFINIVQLKRSFPDKSAVEKAWAYVQQVIKLSLSSAHKAAFHPDFYSTFWNKYGAEIQLAYEQSQRAAESVQLPYKTSFDDPNELMTHFIVGQGKWQIANGVLKSDTGGQIYLRTDLPSADYAIIVRLKMVPEGFVGVFGRARSQTDWDFVIADLMDRHQALRMKVGEYPVTRFNMQIKPGNWYTLRLEVQGTTAKAYVDDVLVGQVQIPSEFSEPGQVGIRWRGNGIEVDSFAVELLPGS